MAIIVVIVAAVAVVANLVLSLNFSTEKVVGRKLEEIARDYYENYYYDNFVGKMSEEEISEELSEMTETGFPRTLLRELLLFDEGRHADEAKYFNHEGYTCDRNKTYVIFFPEAPFGKKDYRVEYGMRCE